MGAQLIAKVGTSWQNNKLTLPRSFYRDLYPQRLAFDSVNTGETFSKENESISTDSISAESLSVVDTAVTDAGTPTISTTTFVGKSFIATEVSTEATSLVVTETRSHTIGALTLSTEVLSITAGTAIATTQATSEATTSDTIGLLTKATSAEPTTSTTEATRKATSEASTRSTAIATTETTTGETTTRSTIEDTTEATTGTTTQSRFEATITTTENISSTTKSTPTTKSVESPAKTNLIQNGGFEDSTNHWDYSGINAHTFLTSNPRYEGNYSYAMGSTYGGEVGITQSLDKSLLRPNTPYKLSIYATTSSLIGCPGGIRIVVDTDRREETFGRYVSAFASAELVAGWRYISGDFTLTDDALMDDEPIKVIVNTLCAPGGNYVYIDNVELVG